MAISDIKTGFQHVSRMNQKKCKQKQIFSEQLDTYEITKPIYLFRVASAQCARLGLFGALMLAATLTLPLPYYANYSNMLSL